MPVDFFFAAGLAEEVVLFCLVLAELVGFFFAEALAAGFFVEALAAVGFFFTFDFAEVFFAAGLAFIEVFFFAAVDAFLAAGFDDVFFAVVFFAVVFLAAGFRAVDFLAVVFFAVVFLAVDDFDLAVAFFAVVGFFLVVVFFAGFLVVAIYVSFLRCNEKNLEMSVPTLRKMCEKKMHSRCIRAKIFCREIAAAKYQDNFRVFTKIFLQLFRGRQRARSGGLREDF